MHSVSLLKETNQLLDQHQEAGLQLLWLAKVLERSWNDAIHSNAFSLASHLHGQHSN